MDSNRSAKRRKLATPQYDSHNPSPGSHSRSTPITYSKMAASGSSQREKASKSTASQNGIPPSPAHKAWQDAKAKSQAMRNQKRMENMKEKEVDVYDDIEGAHGERVFQAVSSPAGTPTKKLLDPLRNQKGGASVTTSPAKGGMLLGFFKQFSKPKSDAQATVSEHDAGRTQTNGLAGPGSKRVEVKKVSDGVSKKTKEQSERQTEDEDEDEDEEDDGEDEDDIQEESAVANGKPAWKGWAYDTGNKKKTLEDEIRELGNAAREQAGNDEDGGPSSAANHSQRKRNRASKFGATEEQSPAPNVQKKAPKGASSNREVTTKLKNVRKDAAVPKSKGDAGVEDSMEIDQTDNGEEEVAAQADLEPRKTRPKTSTEPKEKQLSKSITPSVDATFSPEHLSHIQTVLLEKLNGKRRTRLSNLEQEYAKVSNLISQTVIAGESNSMLLIGARGSGKSVLVNQILYEQGQEHPDDFHVVRLNGFIHTDDKIALREIWRQLGREMELGDQESASKNYADTLTTLLALLSHPAEMGQEQQADQVTKSVIFILDEFELFASHPRQTLLYNLFDIAQSRKAPIAVLGLTTRIDVSESLEKRVKSRFSHRYVHLGFSKSLNMFEEACKAAIKLHHDELSAEEREVLGAKNEVTAKLSKASKTNYCPMTNWNSFIEDLTTDETFTTHLRRIYYTTKSVPEFRTSMLTPTSNLATDAPTTTSALLSHFTTTLTTSTLAPPDSNLPLLHSLSTLHLALLISAARLTNIHNSEIIPFAQAYQEYKVLASKQKLQASASGALGQGAGSRVWSKEVARGAWEDLIKFGLVIEEGNRGGRVDVGLEELGELAGVVEMGGWGRWCREI